MNQLDLFDQIAVTLLHSLWIGTASALVLALSLATILRNSPSATRSLAAWIALIATVLATVAIFRSTEPVGNPNLLAFSRSSLPLFAGDLGLSSSILPTPGWLDWMKTIAILWFAGSTVMLLRFLVGWWNLGKIRRNAQLIQDPAILRAFHTARSRLGIREAVQLRMSDAIDSPIMAGFFWPTVLIPLGLAQGTPASYLQAVFCHELAHHRRWDYAANLIQAILESLFFFHPAIWWISAVIRREREHACDDLAVELTGSPREYAGALAWLESSRMNATGGALLPAPAMRTRTDSTLARVERIVRHRGTYDRGRISPRAFPATLLISGLTICFSLSLFSPPRSMATAPVNEEHSTPTQEKSSIFEEIRQKIRFLDEIRAYLGDAGSSWPSAENSLFVSPVIVERGGTLYDLTREQPQLFEDFPNHYLLGNRLNFLNSALPSTDPDGDGFSVKEEFLAGTDPRSEADHPPLTDKLRFLERLRRLYRIRYDALPDERRAQFTRLPSAAWKQSVYYLAEGETSPDQQVTARSVKDEFVELFHEPTGTQVKLEKRETTEIPNWFARLKLDLGNGVPFIVRKGDRFSLPGDFEIDYRLLDVSDDQAVLETATSGSGEIKSRINIPRLND